MEIMKQLLAGRGVELKGEVSSHEVERVLKWFPHARYIAENFEHFDHLRRNMMHKSKTGGPNVRAVRRYLEDAGLIYSGSGGAAVPVSHDADMFLRGQWLEEYAFMAFCKAGADAVTFHQMIHWEIDGYEGDNEVDVIARIGNRLAFISCKALKPYPGASGSGNYRSTLVNFLNEIDNAQDQFGYPWDTAFLFTTVDLCLDNEDGQPKYGSLLGKARALDVFVLGLDDLCWRRLRPYMTKVVQDIRCEFAPIENGSTHPIHGVMNRPEPTEWR